MIKIKRITGVILSIISVMNLFVSINVAYAEHTSGYTEIYSMDFDAMDAKEFGQATDDITELQTKYPYTKLVSSTKNWGFKIETDSQTESNKYIYLSSTEEATNLAGGKVGIVINPPGGFQNTQKYRISYDVKWDGVTQNGPFVLTKAFHYISTGNNDEFGPFLGAMMIRDSDSEADGFQAEMFGSYSVSNENLEQRDYPLNVSAANRVALSSGEWHKVEIIIDCYDAADKKIDYYYDGAYVGSQRAVENTFPNYAVFGNNSFKISVFQGYHAQNGVYLDNIKVEKAVPGIEKIEFADESGEKRIMSSQVETISKKIEISTMHILDRSALLNSVNLYDQNGSIMLNKNYDAAENILTLEAENYFMPDKEYRLCVLDKVYNFTISPSYSINLMSFKKGDDAVDDNSVLSAGDTLSANIGIIKNINESKSFIFGAACYDGNNMKSFKYKNFSCDETDAEKTDSFTFTVPDCKNLVIKMFVIDNFTNNNSLKDPIVIGKNTDTEKFFTAAGTNESWADKHVAISVFAPDKSEADLVPDTEMVGVLAFYDLIKADSKGTYSTDIRLTGDNVSGEYKATAAVNGSVVQAAGPKMHISSTDNKLAIQELLLETTKDGFIDKALTKQAALGFEHMEDDTARMACEILYNYYSENIVEPTEYDKNIETAKQCERLAMFNTDATEDNIFENDNDFKEVFPDLLSEISEFFTEGYFTQNMQKNITAEVKGTKKLSQLKDVVKEAFILSVTKNSNGYVNLVPVLKKFAPELGISAAKITNDVAREVSGSSCADLKDLAATLSKIIKDQGTSGSSSSSSSSSGGGSGMVSSGIIGGYTSDASKTSEIPKNIYTDVSDEHWARDAIVDLTVKGIMSGTGDGEFKPNDNITREQFTKMIVETFCEDVATESISFSDAVKGAWYYDYIAVAYKEGLINGISDSFFGVGSDITRQDMAVILNRAAQKYNYNFTVPQIAEHFEDDDDISDYAKDAVYTLKDAGIMKGNDNCFAPLAYATRAEAAMVIYNMISM